MVLMVLYGTMGRGTLPASSDHGTMSRVHATSSNGIIVRIGYMLLVVLMMLWVVYLTC